MKVKQTIFLFTLLLALFSACALVQALSLSAVEKLIRERVGHKKFNKVVDRLANSLLSEILPKQTEQSEEVFEEQADAMWPDIRCTNVDNSLNVRTAPYGSIVKTLGPETQVTVFDVTNANDGTKWAKIGNGQWVSAQYLKMSCANALTRCTNVDNSLNVRDAPYGKIVKTLGPEVQVTVHEVSYASDGTKWAKIGYNQWVSAQYLKMSCSNSGNNNNGGGSQEDRATVTLSKIFSSEGKCQNWASDSGNEFQGKIGYTCMVVTPSECWGNRNSIFAPLYSGFNGHPADFCKYAYDKNPTVYKQCAAQLYEQNYFGPGGCNPLPMPAFYVCADIAVNSGVGRSRQYIAELGGYNGQDPKQFARAMNEKHREDYKRWGCPTCKNHVFLAGWLARADERDRFIDSY